MERGGFHGYRRAPQQTPSASELKVALVETNNTNNHSVTDDNECTVREQDRFMPIANVIRIMRKILPPHAKISDEAKETIQECVSEFISFITGEANDRCQREQRKTITAEDVLWGMSKLGFDDYIEPMTMYLNRYREFEGGDRGSLKGEPMAKRAADFGTMSAVPAFVPVFHLGHPHGFFGAPVNMGGFMKDDGSSASSSKAAMNSLEPFAHFNK